MIRKGKTGLRTAVLLAGVLCAAPLSACSGNKMTDDVSDVKSLAGTVADHLQEVKSFSGGLDMDFAASVSYEQSGIDSAIEMKIGMDMDLSATTDPAATEMSGTMSVSVMGQEMNVDLTSYTVEEDGKTVTYADSGDGWTRSEKDTDNDMLNQSIYEKIAGGELNAVLEEDSETVNGREAYVISADLSGEELENFMNESLSGTEEIMGDDDPEWGTGNAEMKILVYKDSMLPAEIRVDCRDFGRAIMEESFGNTEGVSAEVSAFEIGVSFDEYDAVEPIEVPQEALDSATEASDGQ